MLFSLNPIRQQWRVAGLHPDDGVTAYHVDIACADAVGAKVDVVDF